MSQSSDSEKLIKRPIYSKGDTILSKISLNIDGKMTSPDFPKNADIRVSVILRNSEAIEIKTIGKDGFIIEAEVDNMASFIQTSVAGKADDKEINEVNTVGLPLDNQIAVFSLKRGVWIGKLRDEVTPKELAPALENFVSPEDSTLLPIKPVAIGDEWSIKGKQLQRFVPDALNIKGQADCLFEKIVDINGINHALVKVRMQLQYTRIDENQEEQKITETISGNCWIDMKTGIEIEFSGKNSVILETSFQSIKNVKIIGSGSVNITNKLLKRQ